MGQYFRKKNFPAYGRRIFKIFKIEIKIEVLVIQFSKTLPALLITTLFHLS